MKRLIFALGILFLFACSKTSVSVTPPIPIVPQSITLKGKIEKGPFSQGSNITFYELDSSLNQTGKSFASTINDNQGNYQLNFSNIPGKIFRVQTDGFYFNEVLNNISTSRIVLTGISEIDSSKNVNINVLTELERRRVEYLINSKKLTFVAAKKQAISELLNVFQASNSVVSASENSSLLGYNSDLLLSLSVLFQGYRGDAQLSQLLSDFTNDFYNDGKIDSTSILKKLYNHSSIIDTVVVRNNLQTQFGNSATLTFNTFGNFMKLNTNLFDLSYFPIQYPSVYNNIKNLLEKKPVDTILESISSSHIPKNMNPSYLYFQTNVPFFDFKVIIKSDSLHHEAISNGPNVISSANGFSWGYAIGASGWTISSFDAANYGNQSFYSNNCQGPVSIKFFEGSYTLSFYEPSTSSKPTFVKRLIVTQ